MSRFKSFSGRENLRVCVGPKTGEKEGEFSGKVDVSKGPKTQKE